MQVKARPTGCQKRRGPLQREAQTAKAKIENWSGSAVYGSPGPVGEVLIKIRFQRIKFSESTLLAFVAG